MNVGWAEMYPCQTLESLLFAASNARLSFLTTRGSSMPFYYRARRSEEPEQIASDGADLGDILSPC